MSTPDWPTVISDKDIGRVVWRHDDPGNSDACGILLKIDESNIDDPNVYIIEIFDDHVEEDNISNFELNFLEGPDEEGEVGLMNSSIVCLGTRCFEHPECWSARDLKELVYLKSKMTLVGPKHSYEVITDGNNDLVDIKITR